MMEAFNQHLCRTYTIICPACGVENHFDRLKLDIFREDHRENDGYPLKIVWRVEEGEFPAWLSPLHYFWGTCRNCFYTAGLEDADFRQWRGKPARYQGQFHEGTLESVGHLASTGEGVLQTLGRGIDRKDVFGAPLIKFFLGIFCECLKISPASSILARSYLRIAWLYRDEKRRFGRLAASSTVRNTLKAAIPEWDSQFPPCPDDCPARPEIVLNEADALRLAMRYFEWNYRHLHETGLEGEIRLMLLIAEIGFRVYEVTGTAVDFKNAQTLLSTTMQKCLNIMKDKTIAGGAVNRARDALQRAGDRGRELRTLRSRRAKRAPRKPRSPAPAKPGAPRIPAKTPPPDPAPVQVSPPPPPVEPTPENHRPEPREETVESLQERIARLDQETKRWMRLASTSDITELPNRLMLARVMLPGAMKEAIQRGQPLGCLLVSMDNLHEINGRCGRSVGNYVLQRFSEALKELLENGERLSHIEGANFAFLACTHSIDRLRERAQNLHWKLTSRQFDVGEQTFSVKVSMGAALLDSFDDESPKDLQDRLFTAAVNALYTAKLDGNRIEIRENGTPSV